MIEDEPINVVGLCLYHEAADPAMVSDLLKIEPSRSQVRGDLRLDGIPVPRSGWFLDFEGVDRGFERAIDDLVAIVERHVNDFLELRSRGWESKIDIDVDRRVGHTGRLFTAEQMCVLGEAGLDSELWIFAPTPRQ